MTNYEQLYWLTRLDGISHFSEALTIFGLIVFIVTSIGWGVVSSEEGQDYPLVTTLKRLTFRSGGASLLFILILTFTPTKNEAIFIMAGGKTMDFVQNDSSINKIPAKSTEFIVKCLEESIKELDKK